MVHTRLAVLLLLAAVSLTAAEAPEFGRSVTIDNNQPQISMENLEGKVGLVVFFQSW